MKNTIIALGLCISASSVYAADTLVKCGATIDVETERLTGPREFYIRQGRISDDSVDNVEKTIDLSDHTCLPGLIDMHVHLTS